MDVPWQESVGNKEKRPFQQSQQPRPLGPGLGHRWVNWTEEKLELSEEDWVVCERETSLSFIKIHSLSFTSEDHTRFKIFINVEGQWGLENFSKLYRKLSFYEMNEF